MPTRTAVGPHFELPRRERAAHLRRELGVHAARRQPARLAVGPPRVEELEHRERAEGTGRKRGEKSLCNIRREGEYSLVILEGSGGIPL